MRRPHRCALLGLGLALGLSACSAAPQALPSWALGATTSTQAQGELLLELSAPGYRLQGLAELATLRVTLKQPGQPDQARSLLASALLQGQGRVSFPALPIGPVQVEVEGRDAQGALLGFARAEGLIQAGTTTRLPLHLAVGGPAAQGGLGLDLSVADDPASGLVRPLRLVAAAHPPEASVVLVPDFNRTVKDLAFDRKDGHLYVAYGSAGMQRYRPDLQATQATSVPAAHSLAPWPTGGVLAFQRDPNQQHRGYRWTAPDRLAPATGWPEAGVVPVFGATPEGQVVKLHGDGRLEGLTLSNPNPGPGEQWALGPFNTFPEDRFDNFTIPTSFTFSSGEQFNLESGQRSGEVLVSGSYLGLRVNDRGGAEAIVLPRRLTNPTSLPSSTAAWVQLAEADLLTGNGSPPGQLLSLVPDHRGGYWAVKRLDGEDLLMIWHRHGQGGPWRRVWGPWVSPGELSVMAAAPEQLVRSAPGDVPTRLSRMGVLTPSGETQPVMFAGQGYPKASSAPGRLALYNGQGLFVFEEQAASAP